MTSRPMIALALLLSIVSMMVVIPMEGSDAAITYDDAQITVEPGVYVEIDLFDHTGGRTFNHTNYDRTSGDGDLPPGMSRDGHVLKGTPSSIGDYSADFRFHDSLIAMTYDAYLTVNIHVVDSPNEYTVTYNAGIGTVNGNREWTERIVENTYASFPDAVHSTGAYSFLGWAYTRTSATVLPSLVVIEDTILYAVWERNTVGVSELKATVQKDQTASLDVVTDPEDSVVGISSYGGLNTYNISVEGHRLDLDMVGVDPGTYFVTITGAYTGYLTGHAMVTIDVPIVIVEPIEYTLSEGDRFAHTPVTDPTNAAISLKRVVLDGVEQASFGGISVSGRTITGILEQKGTYEIVYTASMDGYVGVTETVMVYVGEGTGSSDPVSLDSVTASPRSGEPRVYDLVAIGGRNVSNYIWSVGGEVFASSSDTALYEFPAAGIYTISCEAVGFDGGSKVIDVTVVCGDNRHREAAWSGVEYGYVVGGSVDAIVPEGSFLSVSHPEMDGMVFTIIAGTPGEGDVGGSFGITAGDESWTLKVYTAEASAPTASFVPTVGEDGFTVSVEFTGVNASFHSFDFDGDGVADDTPYVYERPGRYTVLCTAVNNVSEVTSVEYVEIAVDDVDVSTLDDLTDFVMTVGERLYISIPSGTGSVSIGGTAAGFIVYSDGGLYVSPEEAGVFDLTVCIAYPEVQTECKTIQVTVKERIVPGTDGSERDYMPVMIVLFLIGIGAVASFLFIDSRSSVGNNGPIGHGPDHQYRRRGGGLR